MHSYLQVCTFKIKPSADGSISIDLHIFVVPDAEPDRLLCVDGRSRKEGPKRGKSCA